MNTVEPVWTHWFSPHSRIAQVPLLQVRDRLIGVFEQWGQPGALRVDNGEPLGSPGGFAPPPLSLWLIAQGVKMIWNPPGCPRKNAKVEKLQDTTSRWAEVDNARNTEELQQRLDQQVKLQREHYPVQRLGGKTRLEAFAGLITNQRPYQREDFRAERVWAFFRCCVFTRRLSSGGVLAFLGVRTTIGAPYKRQWAQVRLAPGSLLWEVLVRDKVVKTFSADCLSKERLLDLSVYQKTNSSGQTS